jgi:hypothetical protein
MYRALFFIFFVLIGLMALIFTSLRTSFYTMF